MRSGRLSIILSRAAIKPAQGFDSVSNHRMRIPDVFERESCVASLKTRRNRGERLRSREPRPVIALKEFFNRPIGAPKVRQKFAFLAVELIEKTAAERLSAREHRELRKHGNRVPDAGCPACGRVGIKFHLPGKRKICFFELNPALEHKAPDESQEPLCNAPEKEPKPRIRLRPDINALIKAASAREERVNHLIQNPDGRSAPHGRLRDMPKFVGQHGLEFAPGQVRHQPHADAQILFGTLE